MKKKQTVVVNYLGRKGGGAVYSYEMAKSLKKNGCRVYAIISEGAENVGAWKSLNLEGLVIIPTYDSKFNFLTNTLKFYFYGIRRLKRYFKDIEVDVVYVPMTHSWTSLVNSIFNESQKVVTIHDPIQHSGVSLVQRLLKNDEKAVKDADDIIILSKTFFNLTLQKFKKRKEQVHVIPHGVFDYYKKISNTAEGINYPKNKINFLFFGRITKYKGLHVLADAYKRLSNEYENITLTVVGNGDFDDYREEYSCLENVKIVNRWINDEEVGCFFEGKNIVTVLPYLDATQSGVIPIAMANGSLVIASNTGGLSEQVEHRKTGYLFKTGDSIALYEIMKYVVENYDEQKKILENANEFIDSLSWDVLGQKLIKTFSMKKN